MHLFKCIKKIIFISFQEIKNIENKKMLLIKLIRNSLTSRLFNQKKIINIIKKNSG